MRDQIAEYLAQGYKPAQIAQMLGCSEAYISELFHKDAAFKEQLKELMVKYSTQRINNKYEQLEEATLAQINQVIKTDILDVSDLTRVLEAIARIKNANKANIQAPSHYTNPTIGITLNMPAQNNPEITVDTSNRIISIGTKTMLPMPAKAVRDVFQKRIRDEESEQELTLEKMANG